MRKKIATWLLAFALFLPCVFALTACGPEEQAKAKATGIEIELESTDYTLSNNAISIEWGELIELNANDFKVTATFDNNTTAVIPEKTQNNDGYTFTSELPTTGTATEIGDYDLIFAYGDVESKVITVHIVKKTIDVSALIWDEDEFDFNGEEKTVSLEVPQNLTDLIDVSYEGETATNAGEYTAVATITPEDSEHYVATPATLEHSWTINKADIDVSGVKLATGKTFVYTGEQQTLTVADLEGIPSNVSVTITGEYQGTDADTYTATLQFTCTGDDAANYNAIANKEISWTIGKAGNAITGLALTGWTYGETANNPTATATFGTIVYTYSTEEDGEYEETKPTNAGTYYVKAEVAGTDNYEGTTAKAQFTIAKGQQTVSTLAQLVTAIEADTTNYETTITVTAILEVAEDLVLDLNGKTLSVASDYAFDKIFNIKSTAQVTIKNGTIDGSAKTQTAGEGDKNEIDPIVARENARVTLSDLNVTIDSITGACVYAFANATITIENGTYENKASEDYPYAPEKSALVINQANDYVQRIFITGGTFKGYNPAYGDDSGKVASFIADGYQSVETETDSNIWTVSKNIVNDFADLKANLTAGKSVFVGADIMATEMITLDKDVTVFLNGHTLNYGDNKIFEIVGSATLTIDGTVANSKVVGRFNVGRANENNGNLVLNGGEYEVSDNTVIHVNGNCSQCNVTIKNAKVTSELDNAVQFNGAGNNENKFYIENSEITGYTAIYIKAGNLEVKGSTLTSTGAHKEYEYYGNGSNATGDVVVIDNCWYPHGNVKPYSFDDETTLVNANGTQQIAIYWYVKTEAQLVEAVADGGTIILANNLVATATVEIEKDLVLDLNGKTLSVASDYAFDKIFNIKSTAEVTIKNGTIDGSAKTQTAGEGDKNEIDPIVARENAKVTLSDLNVTIDSITGACVYAFANATITIENGTYENKASEDYPYAPARSALVINQANDYVQRIFITGGTFKGYNPAYGDDSGKVASFIADGYQSVETETDSNIWTVSKIVEE